MALSKSGDEIYLDELQGKKCFCGRKKKADQTFCSQCYYALPSELRGPLYRRFGNGYEEAVDRAKEYLGG